MMLPWIRSTIGNPKNLLNDIIMFHRQNFELLVAILHPLSEFSNFDVWFVITDSDHLQGYTFITICRQNIISNILTSDSWSATLKIDQDTVSSCLVYKIKFQTFWPPWIYRLKFSNFYLKFVINDPDNLPGHVFIVSRWQNRILTSDLWSATLKTFL